MRTENALLSALDALAAGHMVLVADQRDREDEGDLIMDAGAVTTSQMAFLIRHGSGIICAPMPDARADALDLPLMVTRNTDSHGTAFTVSVDHVMTGTGISASDRARTVQALADPGTQAVDLRRPGHVFPLRAHPGGVRARQGHTEATVDLLALAGAGPVGVITELIDLDGVPLGGGRIRDFAREHDVPHLEMDEVVAAVLRGADS